MLKKPVKIEVPPQEALSTELIDTISMYGDANLTAGEKMREDIVGAIEKIKIVVPAPEVKVVPHVEIPKVDFADTNKILADIQSELTKPCEINITLKLI